jgi:hypothetical protein
MKKQAETNEKKTKSDRLLKMQAKCRQRYGLEPVPALETLQFFQIRKKKPEPEIIKDIPVKNSGPKKIIRFPHLEDTPKNIQRPPAEYNNLPSPYGIATEMLKKQLKKGRIVLISHSNKTQLQ